MRVIDEARLEMPYAACRKILEELRRRAAGVCACVEEAFAAYGTPSILNSDQGSVFNSAAYEGLLVGNGVRQSMDGKARWVDNVIVERRFRSLKTECVRIGERGTPAELRRLVAAYVEQYNNARPHQSLGYDTPAQRAAAPVARLRHAGRAVLFGLMAA